MSFQSHPINNNLNPQTLNLTLTHSRCLSLCLAYCLIQSLKLSFTVVALSHRLPPLSSSQSLNHRHSPTEGLSHRRRSLSQQKLSPLLRFFPSAPFTEFSFFLFGLISHLIKLIFAIYSCCLVDKLVEQIWLNPNLDV